MESLLFWFAFFFLVVKGAEHFFHVFVGYLRFFLEASMWFTHPANWVLEDAHSQSLPERDAVGLVFSPTQKPSQDWWRCHLLKQYSCVTWRDAEDRDCFRMWRGATAVKAETKRRACLTARLCKSQVELWSKAACYRSNPVLGKMWNDTSFITMLCHGWEAAWRRVVQHERDEESRQLVLSVKRALSSGLFYADPSKALPESLYHHRRHMWKCHGDSASNAVLCCGISNMSGD